MKSAAVFFDRDNTLIVNDGYLGDPAGVILIDGAARAVACARELDYRVVVISNQSGVAKGIFDEQAVRAVDARMDELLRLGDPKAVIDLHEFCPFHPEAIVEKYRMESELRKPKPGMLLLAARKLDLDLGRSWVIGDAGRDIEAGKAAGCRTILYRPRDVRPSPAAELDAAVVPDAIVARLDSAMDLIAREAGRGA
jgi:HAD superfamily hydrolase (TIGR01662 family)